MNKALSLFSGIGGLDLAAEWAGFTPVAFVEQKPFCQSVLRRHWPDVPIFDDVRTFNAAQYLGIELIVGGFPCQDISAAGKGAGLEGERSGLWFEYLRIIKECKPRFILAENVDALIGRGLDRVLCDMEEAGYATEALSVAASDLGAPHQRKRWFIVGERAAGVALGDSCGSRLPREPRRRAGSEPTDGYVGATALADTESQRRCQPEGWHRGRVPARASAEVGDSPSGGIRCGWTPGQGGFTALPDKGIADVADSDRAGRTQQRGGEPGGEELSPSECQCGRCAQSRVGRAAHGVPARLDTAGRFLWPAGKGPYQKPWESPRTVQGKQPHRASRIEALGNAVCPQQAYPVLAAIARRLKEVEL